MLNPTASATVTSTVTSGAQAMTIDHDGMGTVLSILSNMYSDGNLAVAREYICNALDSHVEAGNTSPVLVTSPNSFDPRLTVQDFGVGLSKDEVLNVYAKYGASTKRNTNDQIGAFGIGAKSAFTVGTQFVVTAVKDGLITVALFALDESGAPTVNIVTHEPTDEPNGVKVEIGVKDVRGVNDALERLCSTFKPGTILVDGVEPATIWADAVEMTENVHLRHRTDKYDQPAFVIVMGGVSYKLPTSVVNSLHMRQRSVVHNVQSSYAQVVLTVGIGAVDITPSREELRDTPKTVATIVAGVDEFYNALPGYISERIDKAPSLIAAMILRRGLQNQIGSFAREHLDAATWRGHKLGFKEIETGLTYFELRKKGRSYYTSDVVARREKDMHLVPSSEVEKMLFVVNTPDRRLRSVQLASKPYLMDSKANHDAKHTRVVAVHGPSFTMEWFDTTDIAIETVEYDDFTAKWKPVVPPGERGSYEIKYTVAGEGDTPLAELKDLDDVVYFHEDEWSNYQRTPYAKGVQQTHTVIVLGKRQSEDAFKKRFPEAEHGYNALKDEAKKILSTMSQDDLDTIAAIEYTQNIDRNWLEFFRQNRNNITNPVVLSLLSQYDRAQKLKDENSTQVERLRSAAGFLNTSIDASKSKLDLTLWTKVKHGLPLLHDLIQWNWTRTLTGLKLNHTVIYVNVTSL